MDQSKLQHLQEKFALSVFARCAPGLTANIEAGGFDVGVRVVNPDRGASERFAVRLVCHRYRAENLPFAEDQTIAELRTHGLIDPVLPPTLGAGAAITFEEFVEYEKLTDEYATESAR